MTNLRFEDLPKAMATVIEKLTLIQNELENIKENFQPEKPDELMTRMEVKDYFKISYPTLHQWTNHRILISYRVGNRVYYRKSEIESKTSR
tara:strand:- start:7700 stop:7972 length:273 start_codon:yes stop_codon:yes gene_type:complete